jgi:hypothetical protein
MPIDFDSLPPPLIEAVKTGHLVPFIGAGVSRHAKSKEGRSFPTWSDFLKELIDYARRSGLSSADARQIYRLVRRGKHLMAAQALKEVISPYQLELYIKGRFGTKEVEVGEIHRALLKLGAPLIITTNYDLLLEKAFAEVFRDTPECHTHKDAPAVQQFLKIHQHGFTRPMIFKIHGTADRPHEIVFAEMDYRHLIYHQPGYRAVLSAVFVTKVVLMLGFSYSDPELTVITESLREYFDERSRPDYIVLPKGEKSQIEQRRLRMDFGLEVIEYEKSSDKHPELLELVEYLTTFAPNHAVTAKSLK